MKQSLSAGMHSLKHICILASAALALLTGCGTDTGMNPLLALLGAGGGAPAITSFSINGVDGVIVGSNIAVTLPAGTDPSSLAPEFEFEGSRVYVGDVRQKSGETLNNFHVPVVYRISGRGGTERNYAVMVKVPLDLAGLVSHLAGSVGGPGYANGTGATARFAQPCGIATDGTDLYVADSDNHAIRKITVSTGAVTTIAGLAGHAGSTDGTGSAARFYKPLGLAYDGGNLYVTEWVNNAVRKIVVATGVVTTFAGSMTEAGSDDGVGTAARFYGPWGIVSDGTYLYVADTYNNTIRRITISTKNVTTFAGSATEFGSDNGIGTAARFFWPRGIVKDGTNLYIADAANHTIRKIVIATKNVSTFAGFPGYPGHADGSGGSSSFYYPAYIASDGTNLFVTEGTNHTVRKIVISNQAVTTLAGSALNSGYVDGAGGDARFHSPEGITAIGGTLYVPDSYNHVIRTVAAATGATGTLAGMGCVTGSDDGMGFDASFNYSFGVATDGVNLYVADTGNHMIRAIDIQTGEVTTLAGLAGNPGSDNGTGSAARFNSPCDLATDGPVLYVTDQVNHTVRRVVIATKEVTTLAGLAGTYGNDDGVGSAARFRFPSGIVTDGLNLYIGDSSNHTIRKMVIATGEVSTLAGLAGTSGSSNGTGGDARFYIPWGLDTNGIFLYVADRWNHAIRAIELANGEVTTIAGLAGTSGSADGTGSAARFNNPIGIAYDGVTLYISDSSNHTIRAMVTGIGAVSTLAGYAGAYGSTDGSGSAARFYGPVGLAIANSNLFVVDSSNRCIRKME